MVTDQPKASLSSGRTQEDNPGGSVTPKEDREKEEHGCGGWRTPHQKSHKGKTGGGPLVDICVSLSLTVQTSTWDDRLDQPPPPEALPEHLHRQPTPSVRLHPGGTTGGRLHVLIRSSALLAHLRAGAEAGWAVGAGRTLEAGQVPQGDGSWAVGHLGRFCPSLAVQEGDLVELLDVCRDTHGAERPDRPT